jgi:hypothetical protein
MATPPAVEAKSELSLKGKHDICGKQNQMYRALQNVCATTGERDQTDSERQNEHHCVSRLQAKNDL